MESEQNKIERTPPYLWKYRTLHESGLDRARRLVVNQEIYFSSPNSFNDPFDCRPYLERTVSAKAQREYARRMTKNSLSDLGRRQRRAAEADLVEKMKKSPQIVEDAYRQSIANAGIFSLSAVENDLLMWPHYADDHKGICVRFHFLALAEQANWVPMRVDYREARPSFAPLETEPARMVELGALTKGLAWKYEREWRIIRGNSAGKTHVCPAPVISGVILGARISAEHRAEVLSWVKLTRRSMEIFQSELNPKRFELDIRPI